MQPIRDFLTNEGINCTIIQKLDKWYINIDIIIGINNDINQIIISILYDDKYSLSVYEVNQKRNLIIDRNLMNKLNYYLNVVDKLNELLEDK
jgi:hypothetical protein